LLPSRIHVDVDGHVEFVLKQGQDLHLIDQASLLRVLVFTQHGEYVENSGTILFAERLIQPVHILRFL